MAGLYNCVTAPALIIHSDTSSVVSSSRGKEALLAGCLVLHSGKLYYTGSMRAAVIADCCWYLMKVFITGDVLVWIWIRGMFCWRRVRDQKKKLDQTSASIKAESRSVMCRYVCTTLCSEAFIPYFSHACTQKSKLLDGLKDLCYPTKPSVLIFADKCHNFTSTYHFQKSGIVSYYILNSERAGTLIQQGEHCDISQIPVDSSSYKSALCGECDTNQSESREKLQIITRSPSTISR